MNKCYERPRVEVLLFEIEDVIMSSVVSNGIGLTLEETLAIDANKIYHTDSNSFHD